MNFFFQCDSKNWIWLKGLNFFFSVWFNELNPFWTWLKELNLFFLTMTQRIELSFRNKSFFWIGLKELIFFCEKYHSKYWTFFMTQRIERCLECGSKKWFFETWLTELNNFLTWLIEIDPFFSTWLKELNFFFQQKNDPTN